MNLYCLQGINGDTSVILSGSNTKKYNTKDKKIGTNQKKLNHYSSLSDNLMKGFKIYQKIDNLLNDTNLSEKLEFTYLGNYPKFTIY